MAALTATVWSSPAAAAPTATGSFSVLTYNVAGRAGDGIDKLGVIYLPR